MGRKKERYSPTDEWPREQGKKGTAGERAAYATEAWTNDPHIPLNGKRGMVVRLMDRFGATLRDEHLMEIRSKVLADQARERAIERGKKVFNPVISQCSKCGNYYTTGAMCGVCAGGFSVLADASEPEPGKEPEPEAAPEEEKEDEVAIEQSNKDRPGAGRSHRDASIRWNFARSFIERNPRATNEEVHRAVSDEFGGTGIGAGSLGDIRRELGVGIVKRRANEAHGWKGAEPVVAEPKATPPAAPPTIPGPPTTRLSAESPEESVKAAIQMLLAEVPTLRKLHLDIDDEGRPSVDFEVETVRVGRVTL